MLVFFKILLWIFFLLCGLASLIGLAALLAGSNTIADISFLFGASTAFVLSIIGLVIADVADRLNYLVEQKTPIQAPVQNDKPIPDIGTDAPAGPYVNPNGERVWHPGGKVKSHAPWTSPF
jgi:hypothetical protein